jgi:hypothetical protein
LFILVSKYSHHIEKNIIFCFLFSSSKNRSLFPIEYLSIPEKTLRAGATQATADLDNDLVAG